MRQATTVMSRYIIKLLVRIFIFFVACIFYFTDRNAFAELMTRPVRYGIAPIHVLWFVFMVMMLRHIFFSENTTMALLKAKGTEYMEKSGYDRLKLYEYVHKQNIRAWRVMLVWLCFNAVWGILYLAEILNNADLLMLSVLYFLCDYICILFYCPFQSLIMGNKCCVNCRIYDWGHFMMFTPMLFIKNFFSWSLFFTSCVVLIHWEIIYAEHPERFWSGSNQHLDCSKCRDKLCRFKKKRTVSKG